MQRLGKYVTIHFAKNRYRKRRERTWQANFRQKRAYWEISLFLLHGLFSRSFSFYVTGDRPGYFHVKVHYRRCCSGVGAKRINIFILRFGIRKSSGNGAAIVCISDTSVQTLYGEHLKYSSIKPSQLILYSWARVISAGFFYFRNLWCSQWTYKGDVY